jgi:hypothetical protein
LRSNLRARRVNEVNCSRYVCPLAESCHVTLELSLPLE